MKHDITSENFMYHVNSLSMAKYIEFSNLREKLCGTVIAARQAEGRKHAEKMNQIEKEYMKAIAPFSHLKDVFNERERYLVLTQNDRNIMVEKMVPYTKMINDVKNKAYADMESKLAEFVRDNL